MSEYLESSFGQYGIEGLNDGKTLEEHNCISDNKRDYIEEVLPFKDPDLLASRIDEISGAEPPKAIDSNKDIAELIKPIRDDISPLYLEAPADSIQITESVEAMKNIEGLEYSEWKESTFEQRVDALQSLEHTIAEVAHRPECHLNVEDMSPENYGYYSHNGEITINSYYIKSDSFADYKECLDTIVHEGRHAYQDYNVNYREVHPRGTEVDNWRMNEQSQIGYLDARMWGFELYQYQPLESDARAFAGDILNQYLKNV